MPRAKKSDLLKPARKRAKTASTHVKPTASAGAIATPAKKGAQPSLEDQVAAVLTSLERLGTKRIREDMPKRYGIYTSKAFGVSMSDMNLLAKRLGRNHELAAALWETGWYEARMVASLVALSCSTARRTPGAKLLDRAATVGANLVHWLQYLSQK